MYSVTYGDVTKFGFELELLFLGCFFGTIDFSVFIHLRFVGVVGGVVGVDCSAFIVVVGVSVDSGTSGMRIVELRFLRFLMRIPISRSVMLWMRIPSSRRMRPVLTILREKNSTLFITRVSTRIGAIIGRSNVGEATGFGEGMDILKGEE